MGGPLRAMADIGTHWFDMVSHVTGLRVTSLSADIQTFHKERRRPRQKTETFGGTLLQSEDVEVVQVKSDDFASVGFHFGKKARGMMTASQVSAGRKNRLSIEIYGSESSVAWDQERPDELWVGHRNAPNQTIVKDPSLLRGTARTLPTSPEVTPRGTAILLSRFSGDFMRRFSIQISRLNIHRWKMVCTR
jgi:predicted dehydrogenase